MTDKDIKKLKKDIKNGLYNDNPLVDFILYYQEEIKQLKKQIRSNEHYIDYLKANEYNRCIVFGFILITLEELHYSKKEIIKIFDKLDGVLDDDHSLKEVMDYYEASGY